MDNNVWTIIFTTLCSGLIATFVTLVWQKWYEQRKEKMNIFNVLMSKRHDITAVESVEALNRIDVVFYHSEKVRKAWADFLEAANETKDTGNLPQKRLDKHLRLLEVMAEDVGYKEIKWDNIKNYYFPNGLAERIQEENVLRRSQIEAAVSQIKAANADVSKVQQTSPQKELESQVLLEVIRNPDGFAKLIDMTTKLNLPSARKNKT